MIKWIIAGFLYITGFMILDEVEGLANWQELTVGMLFVIGTIISQGGKH